MDIPKINDPIRLSAAFWPMLALAEGVYCWRFHPWISDFQIWHRVAGAVLFPFLAAFLVYCVTLFFISIVSDFRSQQQMVGFFLFGMALAGILLAFAWVTYGGSDIPAWVGVAATLVAEVMFLGARETKGPSSARDLRKDR